jgi:hypothetical protein
MHVVAVFEGLEGPLESALSDPAPGADDVGIDLDLDGVPPRYFC